MRKGPPKKNEVDLYCSRLWSEPFFGTKMTPILCSSISFSGVLSTVLAEAPVKPSQAKPSQAKPSQAKPSQAKPSQAKSGPT